MRAWLTGATCAATLPLATVAALAQTDAMPRMELEAQFAGPLRDTLIQRLRDPETGAVCYIYLPAVAPHTPPTESGFVQYGPNTIGSVSCLPPSPVATPSGE